MFNDYVILHTPPPTQPTSNTSSLPSSTEKTASTEKTTQTTTALTNDTSIWQVNLPSNSHADSGATASAAALADCSDLALNEAMTCQELLAFSVAFSAALPTNETTLETFYTTLAKADPATQRPISGQHASAAATAAPSAPSDDTDAVVVIGHNDVLGVRTNGHHAPPAAALHQPTSSPPRSMTAMPTDAGAGTAPEDFACCLDLYLQAKYSDGPTALLRRSSQRPHNRYVQCVVNVWRMVAKVLSYVRRGVRALVDQKYFQQGILLAILINTLSMGIEYHNQPEELTAIVETSNIVFSVIFACEMLLKVVAEGPFRYIANGFNVFDGVIVILR